MAVLIALVFVALIALALINYVRALRRDTRSVETYKEALGRIQQVAEKGRTTPAVSRSGAPHVRIVTRHGDPVTTPVTPVDDAVPAPQPTFITAEPVHGELRAALRAVLSGRLAQRAIGLGVATSLGVAVLVVLGSGHHSPHSPAIAVRSVVPGHAAPSPTAPRITAPPASAVLATSTSPDAAVYTVHSSPIRLSLNAANPCWVEVLSQSPAGAQIFQGVLSAGDEKSFTDPRGLWLRLGYPAGAAIRIDGTTITVPASSAPFDVTVRATAGAPAA